MPAPTNSPQKIITRTIWILSLVSLFTDMASEMLYPIMPVFLQHIGFSVVFIGILEGLAEAIAGLSKPYFGKKSDQLGRRLPFVQVGYSLSAISKPMMAFFFNPIWIFMARTFDRFGKGIRSGARDALLSDECNKETKGRVFGFHRSMDTFGAVLGPLIALIYLYYRPYDYRNLFLIAFLPGVAAIFLSWLIKEKKPGPPRQNSNEKIQFWGFFSYWKKANQPYKKLIFGLILFALFNSSDVFLLLKMKESGLTDTSVIALYIFYNLIFAVLAYPIGLIADRIGLKKIFFIGLLLFVFVYIGFAFFNNIIAFICLLTLYGIYAAATDGIGKAWISNMVPTTETASAIGTFTGMQSIAALFASSICGILWYQFGSMTSFLSTAIISIVVLFYLSRIKHSTADFH
ncbi:MAG: MFS transporter [Chitinophagaceae bacterium]